MDRVQGECPIDWVSAQFLQRIGCFHSDVDFGVTTHLDIRPVLGQQPHHLRVAVLRRDEDWRGVVVHCCVEIRSEPGQHPYHLHVAASRRGVKGRDALAVRARLNIRPELKGGSWRSQKNG